MLPCSMNRHAARALHLFLKYKFVRPQNGFVILSGVQSGAEQVADFDEYLISDAHALWHGRRGDSFSN